MTIKVSGNLLQPWEEHLIRTELEMGDIVPDPYECDGCSCCPDTWPPWRPMDERIYLRGACVIHDCEPRYEGGDFLSFWHRAAARWETDGRIKRNWFRLCDLQPFKGRMAQWQRWEVWLCRGLIRLRFRGLRAAGWIA